jgi:hypothetical protein
MNSKIKELTQYSKKRNLPEQKVEFAGARMVENLGN